MSIEEELRAKLLDGIATFRQDIEQDPQLGDDKLIARLDASQSQAVTLSTLCDLYLDAAWQSALRVARRNQAGSAAQEA